jgi:prepilin-type N-terminal cleavage/methylation domain-containing protein
LKKGRISRTAPPFRLDEPFAIVGADDELVLSPRTGNVRDVREGQMTSNRGRGRRGFSLIEVMTVSLIMGVLASFSVPRFSRAMEQSRANLAVANLRTIWTAQRAYWLQHVDGDGINTFAPDLATLRDAKLIDQALVDQASFDGLGADAQRRITYAYTMTRTDSSTFTATAVRVNSPVWTSTLAIDSNGDVTGNVQYVGSSNFYKNDGPIDTFFQ